MINVNLTRIFSADSAFFLFLLKKLLIRYKYVFRNSALKQKKQRENCDKEDRNFYVSVHAGDERKLIFYLRNGEVTEIILD